VKKEEKMAEITAQMVKDLRERSGAGMMDCKKALNETAGDLEAAVDWLRKKGLAAAAKKAGRVASEGLVATSLHGKVGAVAEINSETDFVARNEQFQNFSKTIADLVAQNKFDATSVANASYPGKSHAVSEELTSMIATIGENMSIRRTQFFEVSQGVVTSYIHNSIADGLGKIGVLVALESAGDASKLEQLGRQLAMHIAAARPEALDVASVDSANLDREKDVLVAQAKASGKPEAIIEKMVEGRIRKYYEEVVLLEQVFVIDGETRIKDVVAKMAKELGTDVTLKAFARFELGEGIEKEEKDFAAEVAAQLAN
jgi:elongation factor Ts